MANGLPWLDHGVEGGPVLYLALEGRLDDCVQHFRSMGAKDDRILILHGHGVKDIMGETFIAAEELKPKLVVVDPLARFMRVEDGNSYSQVTAASDDVLEIARVTGAHIAMVHHMRKAGGDDLDSLLGSTAIGGMVDTVLGLRREGSRRFLTSRQRVGDDLEDSMVIEMEPGTGMTKAGGSAAEAEYYSIAEKITKCCHDSEQGWITQDEIRKGLSVHWSKARQTLSKMVERKEIQREGSGTKGSPFLYAALPKE